MLFKSQAQTTCKELENKEIDYLQRIDEILKQLNDSNDAKNKAIKDNGDLQRRLEKLEFEVQQVNLNMKRNNQELDDARLQLENEVLV